MWAQLATVFSERVAAINTWLSYHERMAEKYKWAARFPWLPVAADPPEPRAYGLPVDSDRPAPRSAAPNSNAAADLGGHTFHPPRF